MKEGQGRMETDEEDFVEMMSKIMINLARERERQQVVKSVVEEVGRFNGD